MKHSVQKFSRTLLLAVAAVGMQASIPDAYATIIIPESHNGLTVWTGRPQSALFEYASVRPRQV